MSRELKRVPLDFNWPINKKWSGFLNPHYIECSHCENGYTSARVRLSALVRLILLSGTDSIKKTNHPFFNIGMHGFSDVIPSNDMSELAEGLSESKPSLCGYDSYKAEKNIIKAAGLDPDIWGICKKCDGHGIDAAHYTAYENWEEQEPPEGDGYQLWEDVTEGSPQSPVFASLEELCEWCETNATTFADFKASKAEWYKMLSNGFVSHKEGNILMF